MRLKEWLDNNNVSQGAFAETLGVKRWCISALANNRRQPSLKLAKAIYMETNGDVNFEDWLQEENDDMPDVCT